MSGRIRSIKPEILDDAVTAGLSDSAFRLFVASIVLADDYGRLRAEPGWLRGQVYWARDIAPAAFAKTIEELAPLILFYVVDGQRYAEIRNWSKHQRVDHPGKPRIPPPSQLSRESREDLAKPSGDSTETLAPDLRSPIPITDPDQRENAGTAGLGSGPDDVWVHYVATVARHRPRRRPTKLSPKDRKAIQQHLRAGLTVDDLKRAVDGLFLSLHHIGQNTRRTEYLEIEYAMRKPATFIALVDDTEPVPAVTQTRLIHTPEEVVSMPDEVREKILKFAGKSDPAEPKRNPGFDFFDRLDAEDAAAGVVR